jgi:hypothetical protein
MQLSNLVVTKIEQFEHRRGVAWEAEVSLDGEVVLVASDEGNGGCVDVRLEGSKRQDRKWLRELEDFCDAKTDSFESLGSAICQADKGDNLEDSLDAWMTVWAEYRGSDYGVDNV